MPSIVPSPYVIAHVRRVQTAEKDPDTGDSVIVDVEPVLRRAQAISQIGHRGSSRQIMDAEHVLHIDTDLHLMVPDPSVYRPQDQVLLFPDVDQDGCYVPDTGVAFWIDGLANDPRQSPWPLLTKCLGGVLVLKRVT